MSEYSKEKLFFLKLNKDFFDKYWVKIIEAKPNGDKYILFLIKLMCESISHNGYLRYNESIPYDEEMLAAVTHTDIDVVRSALEVFKNSKIIEVTEDRSLFIPLVIDMTTSTTEGAERKRIQRETKGGQVADKCPPDIRHKSIENRDKNINRNNNSGEVSVEIENTHAHEGDTDNDLPF